MEKKVYESYLEILREELVPALGCTEPIAIAYATATAASVLEKVIKTDDDGNKKYEGHLNLYCSGNIIKNVKSVTVPNSGGMRGIEAAAVLGMVGGQAERKLEVLEGITEAERIQTAKLLEAQFCTCYLEEGVENLYIRAELTQNGHRAVVVIENKHTNIVLIKKDDEMLLEKKGFQQKKTEKKQDKRDLLNVADILEFAEIVDIKEIEEVIGRQIAMNTAISEEGLRNHYGAEVGRTLLRAYGDDVKVRARAKAAAGSDARMIEYARELKVPKEKMYRALVVSNLVAIHQKNYIGSLSAYCGAVSAACGAGAAISWLNGGDYNAISKTITNALANTSGIVCDGAKSSCAAKIASAVDAAIMAYALEDADHCFQAGEGLVRDNVEDTIRNMGYVGRVGMKDTDVTILNLMINQKKV